MIFLETKRLLLRTHQPEDLEAFREMNMDPEVRRYVGGRAWSREKAEQRFRDQYLGEPSDTFGLWATIFKHNGRYIGYCGLSARFDSDGNLCTNRSGLAFYFARPYWRKGLASEAASALIQKGFSELNLKKIETDFEVGNLASERILQAQGFTFVEESRIHHRVFHKYELLHAAR